MKSKLNPFLPVVSLLLSASMCMAAPIFSWEAGTEGWTSGAPNSIATSSIGATDGLQSLAVSMSNGSIWWNAPTAVGLSAEQRQAIFENATELKVDVTYPNPGYGWVDDLWVTFVIQGEKIAWTELPGQAVPADGNPHTVTVPLTVAQASAMATGNWGQLVLRTAYGNSGPSDALVTIHIDNLRNTVVVDPPPATALYWKGDADDQWTSANWYSNIDGTGTGGSLPTDGTAGIGFAAAGAANLTNFLGANQNVKSIVVTAGVGPVAIDGTHDLTIGSGGIWQDETAMGMFIDTTGGVILSENQMWRNKSTNPMSVSSVISGAGTLTKIGAGPLRLSGDNTYTGGTIVEQGDLTLEHANAIGGPAASLTMNGGTLDLNGLDVTLGSLAGAGGGMIRNTSATPCTLTLDAGSDFAYACQINDVAGSGAVSLVKKGPGIVTSNGVSNFTGSVTIDDGIFSASWGWGVPTYSSFGNAQIAGRQITVNHPGQLSFISNAVFGNNEADTSLLPEIILNGTTLSSTRYNQIGNITLNSSTLDQASSDTGNYQGYQFKGWVKVGGTAGYSSILGSKGNHLSTNTVFDVEDVTGDLTEDLYVSSPLLDQSGDYALAAGGLTKTGAGKMIVSGASTYTGNTTVSQGELSLEAAGLSDSGVTEVATGATLDLNFVGEDTVGSLVLGGVPMTTPGTYGASGSGADFESSLITGVGLIRVVAPASGYSTWAGSNIGGQTADLDYNSDGVDNGIAYFMDDAGAISLPGVVGGVITWTNGGNIAAAQYGAEFVVQTSQDLATWTDVPSGSLTTNTDGPGGSLSYTLPTGQEKLFVRLVVTPN